ncbi:MAG: hypothetical protein ACREAK_03185 [Nitrosarchaeum sp.]
MQQTRCITLTIDAILSLEHALDRGRPTKAEELEIVRTLQPFFAQSYSATFTSQKTGYNIKTTAKYFSKFKEEIIESETPDFIQRCREEKEKTLYTYDNLIYNLYDDKKDIEHLIEVAKKTGNIAQAEKLYRLKLKIIEDIANLVSAKINLTNTATAGDTTKLIRGDKNDTQSDKMETIT